ncbi:antitoxin family protein [Thermococcus thioreducens]|uniref:Antitoxin n=1 Tax=Thermococcus thioreducens TaxID=277988 RepID=A0A0Q2M5S6_9EURY|nr:antitoxin family protein [Thermococcus thioreducens]ASJ11404.1 antitoxin [Thermococcus thioreducens]KQH83425.1 antitoxin [Thermococcus thioreducens]SEW07295.1 Predicted DNA-binding protein, potential antitoxin AbrB/MazE fold [Thermococcus thioreducens]
MEVTVEAVYENGILRPKKKLNLPEGSKVTLKILPKKVSERTFGIVKMEKDEIDAIIEEIEDEWQA